MQADNVGYIFFMNTTDLNADLMDTDLSTFENQ